MTTFLLLTNDDQFKILITYAFIAVIWITISYFFFRWLLAIKLRVKRNDSIIDLLKLIAKKQGISDDEVNHIIHLKSPGELSFSRQLVSNNKSDFSKRRRSFKMGDRRDEENKN